MLVICRLVQKWRGTGKSFGGIAPLKHAAMLLCAAALFFSLQCNVLGASFDCSKARTPTDMAICTTPDLSAKDDKLGGLSRELKAKLQSDPTALASFLTKSRRWLAMRNVCQGEKSCLSMWYDERITELVHALGETPNALPSSSSTPTNTSESPAFRRGQADRQSWEEWFSTQTGDYRAGAEYWASHRSLRNPAPCNATPPSTGADWTAGCVAARQRLSPFDVRRQTEPEYRSGWNHPSPPTAMQFAPGAQASPNSQNESLRHGWLGVQIQEVTPKIAQLLGLPSPEGALVADVTENGPAATAGIEHGDVIISFNNHPIHNVRELPALVATTSIGVNTPIVIWRKRQQIVLNAQLAEMPIPSGPQASPQGAMPDQQTRQKEEAEERKREIAEKKHQEEAAAEAEKERQAAAAIAEQERQLLIQKGTQFSADSGTTWRISRTNNEMTDKVDVSVTSIQINDHGVRAEVKGTCDTTQFPQTVSFTGVIVDDDGKPTIDFPNTQASTGSILAKIRINEKQPDDTLLTTDQYSNKFLLVALFGGEKGRELQNQKAAYENAAIKDQSLRMPFVQLESTWRVMIQIDTSGDQIIIKIPVYDPAILELIKSCGAQITH